ncbi:MAG: hypothetical protein WC162_05760 [Sphaerochaetaceae bacterium]
MKKNVKFSLQNKKFIVRMTDMQVIETFIKGKRNQEQCEDGLFINENFISVVDGATSQNKLYYFKTSGQIAKDLIIENLEKLDSNATMEESFNFLNDCITKYYKEKNLYAQIKNNPEKKFSACIILYSKIRKELWFLGDSKALIDTNYYCFEDVADEYFSNLRSYLITAEILGGLKTEAELLEKDTVRESLYPLMKKQHYLQNNSKAGLYGFSVLSGFPIVPSHMHKVKVPNTTKQVVISSDGYPFLKPTLQESEKVLATLLKEDPLLYKKFKSTKGIAKENCSYDDRTYVRFIP